MSTTRCKIPIGYFYGHINVPRENTDSSDQLQSSTSSAISDTSNQLNVLSVLMEDVNCRYSLACSKLKDLLHPFLTSNVTNTSHMSAYMNIMKECNGSNVSSDNVKLFSAYQVCIFFARDPIHQIPKLNKERVSTFL